MLAWNGLTDDDKCVSAHALHILHNAPRVAPHKAPLVRYYSTCLHCCLLTEGLRTTFQHAGGISELSSTFTNALLPDTPVHPVERWALHQNPLQDCAWNRCVALGDTNQRQQRKSARCHAASCMSLRSSNQESQRVAWLCRQHGWHFCGSCAQRRSTDR